jgi:hypothetical protein
LFIILNILSILFEFLFMNRQQFVKKRRETAAKSIEELIELLSSNDLQTRFFAEMCLQDFYVIEFQTGGFAGRTRKSHRGMARMAEGKRKKI